MKNVFVHTQNAKNFIGAMKESEKANEPQLLAFYGQAGRGKTSAARFFAAQEGWIYSRALKGWTDLWMLMDLCFEMKVDPIPRRKRPCFEAIVRKLIDQPKPVVIDEADKLNEDLLEWVRDLADKTYVPFALVARSSSSIRWRRSAGSGAGP
jgi:DNA transposition AAA+ family ATPase